MSIAVVTDSTSDLPVDLAEKHGISVIPLNVHIKDETFLDGVTISADEMYRQLPDSKVIPTTSAPSVGSFIELYEELAKTHDEIISIHLSSKLSMTHNSAVNAVEEMNASSTRISVVDTQQASMALGWTAVRVAEAISDGASLDEATDLANNLSERAVFIGMVDTLTYLLRGGRIGKAQGFVGSLLRVRPLLILRDGEAHPMERARNRKKGIARLRHWRLSTRRSKNWRCSIRPMRLMLEISQMMWLSSLQMGLRPLHNSALWLVTTSGPARSGSG